MKKIVYLIIPLLSIGLVSSIFANYEDRNQNAYDSQAMHGKTSNMTPSQYRQATNHPGNSEGQSALMHSKQSPYFNKVGETNRRPTNYDNRSRWNINNTRYNRF